MDRENRHAVSTDPARDESRRINQQRLPLTERSIAEGPGRTAVAEEPPVASGSPETAAAKGYSTNQNLMPLAQRLSDSARADMVAAYALAERYGAARKASSDPMADLDRRLGIVPADGEAQQ